VQNDVEPLFECGQVSCEVAGQRSSGVRVCDAQGHLGLRPEQLGGECQDVS
jgi:hypothetical protein